MTMMVVELCVCVYVCDRGITFSVVVENENHKIGFDKTRWNDEW